MRAAMKSSIGWTLFIVERVASGLNALGVGSTGAALAALLPLTRFYAQLLVNGKYSSVNKPLVSYAPNLAELQHEMSDASLIYGAKFL